MKKFLLLFPALLFIAVFIAFNTSTVPVSGQSDATIPDSARAMATGECLQMGKLVFVDSKCNNCHTVQSANLTEKKVASSKAPDLSGVGTKFPAEDIMQFITKEKEHGSNKHPIAFKGEKRDLYALSLWLASLKNP